MTDAEYREWLIVVIRLRMMAPEYRRAAIEFAALFSNDEIIERMHGARMFGEPLDSLSPEQFSERLKSVAAEVRSMQ